MGRKKSSAISRALKKKKGPSFSGQDTYTIIGIILMILSLLSFIGAFTHISVLNFIYLSLGYGIIIFAIFAFLLSLRFLGTKIKFNTVSAISGIIIFMLSALAFLNVLYPSNLSLTLSGEGKLGGAIGYLLSQLMINHFTKIGSFIILIPIIIVSFLMAISFSFVEALRSIKWGINIIIEYIMSFIISEEENNVNKGDNIENLEFEIKGTNPQTGSGMIGDLSGGNIMNKYKKVDVAQTEYTPVFYENWKTPPIDFLKIIKKIEVVNAQDIKKNSEIIERTLLSFDITSKVVDVDIGSVVTRYALQITMGTKVSKINNLSRDIALALAAPSGTVRIEAPIPGTSLVGIEVPNSKFQIVGLRNIVDTAEFNNPKIRLPLAMGEDVTGKIIIRDLAAMPHVLVAGSTGSGKSMLINSFLMGLLYRHSPDTLKIIMIDPKHVELSVYNGIPHLLTPVITDMDNVNNALKWAVREMEQRYNILKADGARNIEGYNENKENAEKMSNIVIVIDEMADLILAKGVEIEHSIVRLAQMARAVGIHLILATQRPSVNVITGLIKANIPARISLSVASVIDSRVILDQQGAETLLGKGDMLFKAPDLGKTMRLQGALISEEEISKVITFISQQGTEFAYNEEILTPLRENIIHGGDGSYEDNLFPEAVRVVVEAQRGSASILQSKLKIGYARAARLILELENSGVVGPQDGSKPRDVLIDDADNFLQP